MVDGAIRRLPARKPPPDGFLAASSLSPAGLVLGAGALACALLSVLALAREILPDAPAKLAAVVEETQIGPGMAFEEFLRRPGADEPPPDESELPSRTGHLGVVISFAATVRGLRGEVLIVDWALYTFDARSRALVSLLAHGRSELLPVEADFERLSKDIWVPLPRRPGPYIVHIAVFRQAKRLAFTYTRVFRRRVSP